MAGLTIGRFAAEQGVGVETVRFYRRRGLLARQEPAGSGYREYTEDGNRGDCLALHVGETQGAPR